MRKNAKKIFTLLLLAVVACGSYFISGTYAKYSRALSGSDKATVAKFSVSGAGLNKEETATFDLFNTLMEADTTTAEGNVKADKIAPGTGGKITATLTNDSEVDVEAVVTLSETNASNVPIEYSLDGSTWDTAANTTKTVNLAYNGKTGDGVSNTGDVTVYWRWAFEKNTVEDDTALGEMETLPTVETKVTVTFTQVD